MAPCRATSRSDLVVCWAEAQHTILPTSHALIHQVSVRSLQDIISRLPSELVASFPSRRSFSHSSWCRAAASYESDAVRKMRAAPWQSMGENARDRCVFGPCAPDVLTTRISVLSYNFKRLEIFTKLATSSDDIASPRPVARL